MLHLVFNLTLRNDYNLHSHFTPHHYILHLHHCPHLHLIIRCDHCNIGFRKYQYSWRDLCILMIEFEIGNFYQIQTVAVASGKRSLSFHLCLCNHLFQLGIAPQNQCLRCVSRWTIDNSLIPPVAVIHLLLVKSGETLEYSLCRTFYTWHYSHLP